MVFQDTTPRPTQNADTTLAAGLNGLTQADIRDLAALTERFGAQAPQSFQKLTQGSKLFSDGNQTPAEFSRRFLALSAEDRAIAFSGIRIMAIHMLLADGVGNPGTRAFMNAYERSLPPEPPPPLKMPYAK